LATIALIGPDGAGKTTIARRLIAEQPLRFRYLYMGVSLTSSNLTLPTSRWARRLQQSERARPSGTRKRGFLRSMARLVNRLAEAWFRQLVSWVLQLRGFIVLYDRHFVLDYAPEVVGLREEPLDRRIHRWLVTRVFPRPDLIIFLDVPGTILFARKGEMTPAELERRRQGFLRKGARLSGFVCVDANAPLDEVYPRVRDVVNDFVASGFRSGAVDPQPPGSLRLGEGS
jgi:thymidylate kinase